MCRAKDCSAFNLQCAGCKKYGHVKRCGNHRTRAVARNTKEHKAHTVDEDNDNDVNAILNVRVTDKAEKKARQKAQKAELRKAVVEEDQEDVEVFTINQVTTKNNPHQQRVSSGARR